MTTVATLDTRLNLDSTSFDTGLRRSRGNAQRFAQETARDLRGLERAGAGVSTTFTNLAASIAASAARAGPGLILAGIAAVGAGLTKGVRNSEDYQKSLLRLEAVFKATGGTAGVTVRQVDQFAERLERTTLTNSEAIKDAAAGLATFKSISGDAFFRTIELGQDLAAVFGGDLRSSVTQLGKALEEPITGLSALREKGVTFSATQKEQIRLFVEAGEAAKAQGLILDTLADQVGGAGKAEASGLTGAFAAFNAELGDFLQLAAEASGAAGLVEQSFRGLADLVAAGSEALAPPDISNQIVALDRRVVEEQQRLAGLKLAPANPFIGREIAETEKRIEAFRAESAALLEKARAEAQALDAAEDQAKAAAESAKASVAAEAAAAKATEASTKRNEEAKKAAEERAKAIESVLGPLRLEADEAARLAAAQGQGKAAVDALNQTLEIEAALRAAGVSATSKQGTEIAKLIKLRDSETKAIEDQRKADERRAAVADQANRRRFDRGFDPTRAAEEFRAGQAADAEAIRQAGASIGEAVVTPFVELDEAGAASLAAVLRALRA